MRTADFAQLTGEAAAGDGFDVVSFGPADVARSGNTQTTDLEVFRWTPSRAVGGAIVSEPIPAVGETVSVRTLHRQDKRPVPPTGSTVALDLLSLAEWDRRAASKVPREAEDRELIVSFEDAGGGVLPHLGGELTARLRGDDPGGLQGFVGRHVLQTVTLRRDDVERVFRGPVRLPLRGRAEIDLGGHVAWRFADRGLSVPSEQRRVDGPIRLAVGAERGYAVVGRFANLKAVFPERRPQARLAEADEPTESVLKAADEK